MDGTITTSRTCEVPFDAVAQLLRSDPGQALKAPTQAVTGRGAGITVHLHPRWPWRGHDEEVAARVGRLEAVSSGQARVNLSWQPAHTRRLPSVDGHLEISQVSSEICEFRYVGQYSRRGGLIGKVQEATQGHRHIDDAVGQLLDTSLQNLRDHLAEPL